MADRAQAIGIARLFLALIIGAAVVWVVNEITAPLFARAEAAGGSAAQQQGTQWLQEGVLFLPVAFLLVSFFGLVAYSVYSREVLG